MRIVLLKEIPDDPILRREWNALVDRVEQPQVFFTYEWALAVQRAYSDTLFPLIFLAYEEKGEEKDQPLCGVVALASDASVTHISFLCATTGDYCDFLSSPELKPAFVSGVLEELRRMDVSNATLTNLPSDSTTVAALQKGAASSNYHLFMRTAYVCAQVSLSQLERRPGESKPVLPRKKMLRRFLNAMGREAPVRLDHARTWETVAPILPQFRLSHIARFLMTGRISNLARRERCVFLEELAKLLGERGWLALTRMMSGANAFAWNYGFQFRDTWFWYQPTFDSDLEKYSPGFCLLAKVIEEAADDQSMKMVDLGLGAEEYKERFANQSRKTLCVTLRTSVVGYFREILRHRASELVRTSPEVERIVRMLVRRLANFRALIAQDGALAAIRHLVRKISLLVSSKTEVLFYEWCGPSPSDESQLSLEPLRLEHLAVATSQYAEDEQTLTYLLRSAARLRSGKAEGFVLLNGVGRIVHLAWATGFDGFFLSELNASVSAPAPDCVMLFDCWTPLSERGRGYYGQAVERVATRIQGKGKKPWIFSAASNRSSIHGLRRAGFEPRHRLARYSILGWQKVSGETPLSCPAQTAEVAGRV